MLETSRSADAPRVGVLIINTGSPDAPEAGAVREYLAEFLSDPRVIELPKWKWWPILHGIILRVRPKRSAERYRGVWTDEGSPLIAHTRRTAERLAETLGGGVRVAWAMRYGRPAAGAAFRELAETGCDRILVMPMFAQYASQTTAACFDAVFDELRRMRSQPALRTVREYHLEPEYIDALAARVRADWAERGSPVEVGGRLIMSFHGIPARSTELGDVYESQCRETARALAQRLELPDDAWDLCFQSRFGREEWLKPYTLPFVEDLGRRGVPRVDVICPGFAADCLETIEEIGDELRGAYLAANPKGSFGYIPALNAGDDAVAAYAAVIRRALAGWI